MMFVGTVETLTTEIVPELARALVFQLRLPVKGGKVTDAKLPVLPAGKSVKLLPFVSAGPTFVTTRFAPVNVNPAPLMRSNRSEVCELVRFNSINTVPPVQLGLLDTVNVPIEVPGEILLPEAMMMGAATIPVPPRVVEFVIKTGAPE